MFFYSSALFLEEKTALMPFFLILVKRIFNLFYESAEIKTVGIIGLATIPFPTA